MREAEAAPKDKQKRGARAPSGAARLRAVREVVRLDAEPWGALDRVTRLARSIFDVPVVLLTLVDDRRQYFLSQQGLSGPWAADRETPLSHSLCQHVVATRHPLVIGDARKFPLTVSSPAIRELGVVAYLGVPLEDPEGHILGALCIIDHRPRDWAAPAMDLLQDISRIAMDEIVLRKTLRRQEEIEAAARAANDRSRSLAADLSHRVNNAVAIIGSVVRHSLRTADSLPQAARALEGRLRALVMTHDLMNRNAAADGRLLGVVTTVLRQFGRSARGISLKGEDIALPSGLALFFALTVHELASNAFRHGSLMSPVGRVHLRWRLIFRLDGSRQIVFLWLEEGGPSVARPQRLGFGTALIRRLAEAQGVAVRIDYRSVGLRCLLRAPLRASAAESSGSPAPAKGRFQNLQT